MLTLRRNHAGDHTSKVGALVVVNSDGGRALKARIALHRTQIAVRRGESFRDSGVAKSVRPSRDIHALAQIAHQLTYRLAC